MESGNRPGSSQNIPTSCQFTHETFKVPPPALGRRVATKQPRYQVSATTAPLDEDRRDNVHQHPVSMAPYPQEQQYPFYSPVAQLPGLSNNWVDPHYNSIMQPQHGFDETYPTDFGSTSDFKASSEVCNQDPPADQGAQGQNNTIEGPVSSNGSTKNPMGYRSQTSRSPTKGLTRPRESTVDSSDNETNYTPPRKDKKRRLGTNSERSQASKASTSDSKQRKKGRGGPSKATKSKGNALHRQAVSAPKVSDTGKAHKPLTRDEEAIIDNIVNRQRGAAGKAPRKSTSLNKLVQSTDVEDQVDEEDAHQPIKELSSSDLNEFLIAPLTSYQRPVPWPGSTSSGSQKSANPNSLKDDGLNMPSYCAPVAPMHSRQPARSGTNASSAVSSLLWNNAASNHTIPPRGLFLTGINPYAATTIPTPNPLPVTAAQPSNNFARARNSSYTPTNLRVPSSQQGASAFSKSSGSYLSRNRHSNQPPIPPSYSGRKRNAPTHGLQDMDFLRLPFETAAISNSGRRVVPDNKSRNSPGEDIARIRDIAQRLAQEWITKIYGHNQRALEAEDPMEQELIEILMSDQLRPPNEQSKQQAAYRLLTIVKRLAVPVEIRQQSNILPKVAAENDVVREILQEVLIDLPVLEYKTAHARATLIHMMLMNRYVEVEQAQPGPAAFGIPFDDGQSVLQQSQHHPQGFGFAYEQEQLPVPSFPGPGTIPGYGGSIAPMQPVITNAIAADQQLNEHRMWLQKILGSKEQVDDAEMAHPEDLLEPQEPVPEQGFENNFDDEFEAIMASRSTSDRAQDEEMIPI